MKKITKYLNSLKSLKNKKIIITGANSGVGFALADNCLYKGASIVMCCRSETRAKDAKIKLLNKYPKANIEILLYDQSSIKSCRLLTKKIIVEHNDFYALVLNAGVFNQGKSVLTKDNFPVVSGVNSFGTLAILDGLDEFLLTVDEEKRIVILSSLASRLNVCENIEKSLLNPYEHHFYQYNCSKNACLNIFDYYSNKNMNPYVKYLVSEPGICYSNIIRNYPKWFYPIANFGMKVLFQSAAMGAIPTNYLLSEIVANGEANKPSCLLSTRGLPKSYIVKEKYLNKDLVPQMLKMIKRK